METAEPAETMDMDQDADTLVWPPSDEELDALVALPLRPAAPDAAAPDAAETDRAAPDSAPSGEAAPAPAAPDPRGPQPAASLPLRAAHPPADLLHGLADFAHRRIAGDLVLHRPPADSPRAGVWALAAAGLAIASYAAYLLGARFW